MRYQGSEAYSMRAAERELERPYERPATSFEVVSGGGLDAQARRGVSHEFLARARTVAAVALFLFVLGLARVALSAATVAVLQTNSDLTTQIEEAEKLSSDLRIERSVLSSNARITRIATQNYGMVLTGDAVTVDLGSANEAQAADGEAAQTGDAASAQPDMS